MKSKRIQNLSPESKKCCGFGSAVSMFSSVPCPTHSSPLTATIFFFVWKTILTSILGKGTFFYFVNKQINHALHSDTHWTGCIKRTYTEMMLWKYRRIRLCKHNFLLKEKFVEKRNDISKWKIYFKNEFDVSLVDIYLSNLVYLGEECYFHIKLKQTFRFHSSFAYCVYTLQSVWIIIRVGEKTFHFHNKMRK